MRAQTQCSLHQQPQKAESTVSINPPHGFFTSSFSPAQPPLITSWDHFIRWLPCSALSNALTLHMRLRIFQMFMSVFLNTPPALCSNQPDLPPPAGRTPPLTSCPCQPHPASLAALKFDLLMKLTASSSSPAPIPQGSEQLLTFNSYLIYIVLYLILPLWFSLGFNASLWKAETTSYAILDLLQYLERWQIIVPIPWFCIAFNQAGVWIVRAGPSSFSSA